jgi:hypothetical protein
VKIRPVDSIVGYQDANEISTVLSIYEILFLHLSQHSVGHGIGGNLQVFTNAMPVLWRSLFTASKAHLQSLVAIIPNLTSPVFLWKYSARFLITGKF